MTTRSVALSRFLGLTEADFDLLDRHRECLVQGADDLARDFYRYLQGHGETAAIFQTFSAERLERLIQKQIAHACDLLSNRLDTDWLHAMHQVGRLHYQYGIEPAWVAGAYTLYWRHWAHALPNAMPRAEGDLLRDVLFRLLIGDLMMQLDGYREAARETDEERQGVFDTLLQVLSLPGLADDPDGGHLLNSICTELVRKNAAIAWAGYAVQDNDDTLVCSYMAGTGPEGLRIPRISGDACWAAFDRKESIIQTMDEGVPSWAQALPGTLAEIAYFPFGSGPLRAIGVIGARQRGYFQRLGPAYFLAFTHLGDLIMRMRAQSLDDPLTGLPNRRLFFERLGYARLQSQRRERLLAVALLDLDGFKQVNDRLGHPAGDALLRQVVTRLQGLLRADDTLARMGGDEFGLLLPDLGQVDDLEPLCDQIIEAMRTPFLIQDEPVTISGSLGVTLYPLDDGDVETLVCHADLALYAAKERGRNQYQMHSSALAARAVAKMDARTLVGRGLRDNRLLLYYQPIVVATDDQQPHVVRGMEALLRLQDSHGAILSAEVFADALDYAGLARPIGCFVLNTALAQGEIWHRQGLALRVSINISTHHLLDGHFSTDMAEALARYPDLPRQFIEIEVTETAPLRDFEGARRALQACNALGVRVALDDFGTGNASLVYLQQLPTQTIKIDQSFVRGMIDDPRNVAIIAGVITTARLLGIEVTAEGVETLSHASRLAALGCHFLQGYVIAQPMPTAEVASWVAQYESHFGTDKPLGCV